jgi:hypothetical protein
VTTIKRRIQVEGNLYFEYEVSPHRAILARRSGLTADDVNEAGGLGFAWDYYEKRRRWPQ